MQKYYKLAVWLLACFLGKNFDATSTTDAATRLRTAVRDCVVDSGDFRDKLLTGEAFTSPETGLAQARRKVNRVFANALCTALEGAHAAAATGEETLAAHQAAEGITVGPATLEGVELKSAAAHVPAIAQMIENGFTGDRSLIKCLERRLYCGIINQEVFQCNFDKLLAKGMSYKEALFYTLKASSSVPANGSIHYYFCIGNKIYLQLVDGSLIEKPNLKRGNELPNLPGEYEVVTADQA